MFNFCLNFWKNNFKKKMHFFGLPFAQQTDALFLNILSSIAKVILSSVQLLSHVRPTLCDPKDCSTSGFPVHHQLLELAQTHVHRVGDTIQRSHTLSSPSSPTFNLSQHQGLFQGISSLPQVAKVLEFQHQSFQ